MPRIFDDINNVSLNDFIHMSELLDERGQVKGHVVEKRIRQLFSKEALEKSGSKPVGFVSQRSNQMWQKTKQGNWSAYDPFKQNSKFYVPKKTGRSERSHFEAARSLSKEITTSPRNLSEQSRKKYREAKSFLAASNGRARTSAQRVIGQVSRETGITQQSHIRQSPALSLASGSLTAVSMTLVEWGESLSKGLSQWMYGNDNHKSHCRAAIWGWLLLQVVEEWSAYYKREVDSRNRYRSDDTLPNRLANLTVGLFRSVTQNLTLPHANANRVLGSMERHIHQMFQAVGQFQEGRALKQQKTKRGEQSFEQAFARMRKNLDAKNSLQKSMQALKQWRV